MKKIRVLSSAFLFLAVGGSAVAGAQSERRREPDRSRQPVTQAEQHQRVQDEQRRTTVYRQQLDQQTRVMQQQQAALQQQRRVAQVRYQQQYALQLQQQRQRLNAQRDYQNDPYINAPDTYRYRVDGTTRQTNQYGADVLRQAVNYGYQQGLNAGAADRQDHWTANYSASAAYRDANYGYTGNYVDQADYNYYFRQGFRRGYDDGYKQQTQYGTTSNGSSSILGNLLTSILGFQTIR